MSNQDLGEVLRVLRRRKGLTQDAVAEVLKIKRPTYSAWESGKSRPSIDAISILARLYDVSIDDIIEYKTTLSTDRLPIDSKVLEVVGGLTLPHGSPGDGEMRKVEQVIALMEHNLVHIALLAYGESLGDVAIQGRAIYAIATAKNGATMKIQRKIRAITANAESCVSQQVEQ